MQSFTPTKYCDQGVLESNPIIGREVGYTLESPPQGQHRDKTTIHILMHTYGQFRNQKWT